MVFSVGVENHCAGVGERVHQSYIRYPHSPPAAQCSQLEYNKLTTSNFLKASRASVSVTPWFRHTTLNSDSSIDPSPKIIN